jgi:hypothetical protein
MPSVPRELAEHSVHVRPDAKPVKQPLRCFAKENRKAIGEEIAWLLAAGFIMEVFYPDWLANPVLVLKKNNTWRMCIDYTRLNNVSVLDTGVSQSTCSWATSTAQLWPRSAMKIEPNKEDPYEEELHEKNDDKMLRTRRPPCEGLLTRTGTRSSTAQRNPTLVKG